MSKFYRVQVMFEYEWYYAKAKVWYTDIFRALVFTQSPEDWDYSKLESEIEDYTQNHYGSSVHTFKKIGDYHEKAEVDVEEIDVDLDEIDVWHEEI